jgi:hypothetical protein
VALQFLLYVGHLLRRSLEPLVGGAQCDFSEYSPLKIQTEIHLTEPPYLVNLPQAVSHRRPFHFGPLVNFYSFACEFLLIHWGKFLQELMIGTLSY